MQHGIIIIIGIAFSRFGGRSMGTSIKS